MSAGLVCCVIGSGLFREPRYLICHRPVIAGSCPNCRTPFISLPLSLSLSHSLSLSLSLSLFSLCPMFWLQQQQTTKEKEKKDWPLPIPETSHWVLRVDTYHSLSLRLVKKCLRFKLQCTSVGSQCAISWGKAVILSEHLLFLAINWPVSASSCLVVDPPHACLSVCPWLSVCLAVHPTLALCYIAEGRESRVVLKRVKSRSEANPDKVVKTFWAMLFVSLEQNCLSVHLSLLFHEKSVSQFCSLFQVFSLPFQFCQASRSSRCQCLRYWQQDLSHPAGQVRFLGLQNVLVVEKNSQVLKCLKKKKLPSQIPSYCHINIMHTCKLGKRRIVDWCGILWKPEMIRQLCVDCCYACQAAPTRPSLLLDMWEVHVRSFVLVFAVFWSVFRRKHPANISLSKCFWHEPKLGS